MQHSAFLLCGGMYERRGKANTSRVFRPRKKVLEMLPEGEVEGLAGYRAKWLVVELVAESLGGRVIWDWQGR